VGSTSVDSTRESAILEKLKQLFLADFSVGQAPYNYTAEKAQKMASIRALAWWTLYSKNKSGQLQADQSRAGVSDASMRALKAHQYPLPFKSRNDLLSMCRAIRTAIQKDAPDLGSDVKILVSGSGGMFYSENPDKPGHHFDKNPSDLSDIDVALAFRDLNKALQHFGSPPYSPKFGSIQWGASATLGAFPSLKDFYNTFGEHPYSRIGDRHNKIYKREIGIVTLNFNWHLSSTSSKHWAKDYVYDAATDTILASKRGSDPLGIL
jgi:hypothetical protein